ncbi:MAG: hypothetical protein AAGA60_26805 [Cyanobacteria bacterium P01_E01_bin.42]
MPDLFGKSQTRQNKDCLIISQSILGLNAVKPRYNLPIADVMPKYPFKKTFRFLRSIAAIATLFLPKKL